jgi:hypothetical protein
MLENKHILSAVTQNVLWYYESYDHQKAVEHMENSQGHTYKFKLHGHDIPNDIKRLFSVWRIGKLRQMRFNNQGMIQRVFIGKRYNKSFWHVELGIKAKPIFESQHHDPYGLIQAGVAVTIDDIKKDLKTSEIKYYETCIER